MFFSGKFAVDDAGDILSGVYGFDSSFYTIAHCICSAGKKIQKGRFMAQRYDDLIGRKLAGRLIVGGGVVWGTRC